MRDRKRFSNRKRGSQPSRSTAVVPSGMNQLRRSDGKRRRDRKSSGGSLFALFGLDGARRKRRSVNDKSTDHQGRRKSVATTNRLINFQSAASPRSKSRKSSRSASAAVIPLHRQVPSARSRRRNARRSANPFKLSPNLVQLPAPRSTSGKLMLYGTRLLIFGVGIGVLAGTMLSVWDPASRLSAPDPAPTAAVQVKPVQTLSLGQEIPDLKGEITNLVAQQKPGTEAGVMLLDLDTQAYVDVNAANPFPAASTIKFPVLVAFFQDVDAGKIQLNELLEMRQAQVAKEAGSMQYQPVGTKFSAIETATQMMVSSDNTATNMLIDRLGGIAALNQRFKDWGMSNTVLENPLPDIQGSNITTPKDLAALMNQVQQGQLVSMKSRDRLLEIMRQIENDSLLPQGLGQGATIAHKTGTLGILIGDVGLIDTPMVSVIWRLFW